MRVINTSDDFISPILYGMDNGVMNSYYTKKYNEIKPYLTNTNTFKSYYDTVAETHTDRYADKLKEALFQMGVSGRDDDNIYYYDDSRDANVITREWIMSNPFISKLYERKLVSGYAGTTYKHDEYMSRVRYMSVVSGYLDEHEDVDGIIEYYNDDMIELSRYDNKTIRRNWEKAVMMFNDDIDPTE